jgi:hypothetical protein
MGNIVVFKNFSNFSEYLNQKNFILLDGATGTLIQILLRISDIAAEIASLGIVQIYLREADKPEVRGRVS